jgi:hypothetical protein
MARGWESKAVADQIEEGKAEPLRSNVTQSSARVESLKLSRARLLEQLDKARHAAHREMLMKGLASIEDELESALAEEPEEKASLK